MHCYLTLNYDCKLVIISNTLYYFLGNTLSGWASLVSVICLLCGFQLISIGIIGEYVGKIYLEVKNRPRFIISKRTKHNE